MRVKEETGNVYGKLTVLERAKSKGKGARWKCRCECGRKVILPGIGLRWGDHKSCGRGSCHLSYRHGVYSENKKNHAEVKTWFNMIERCTNPKATGYSDYGGRGIRVLYDNFKAFLTDVGKRPGKEYSIDRKNNNDHYKPGNCQWVTIHDQSRNKRSSRILNHNGMSLCVVDWAMYLECNPSTLYRRLKKGWTTERILNIP